MNRGSVSEIVGVVVDVDFADGELPSIRNALEIARGEEGILVLEVQQHLGENRVRCVAMDSTDGLTRGTEAADTGGPITVPVGAEVLGRLLNVTGDPIDGNMYLKSDAELKKLGVKTLPRTLHRENCALPVHDPAIE